MRTLNNSIDDEQMQCLLNKVEQELPKIEVKYNRKALIYEIEKFHKSMTFDKNYNNIKKDIMFEIKRFFEKNKNTLLPYADLTITGAAALCVIGSNPADLLHFNPFNFTKNFRT